MVLHLGGGWPTFEPPVHLAPPLEGNLFPSCYCIDVFLFTLQEQHQTVACEGVYRLHEIRVLSTRVTRSYAFSVFLVGNSGLVAVCFLCVSFLSCVISCM